MSFCDRLEKNRNICISFVKYVTPNRDRLIKQENVYTVCGIRHNFLDQKLITTFKNVVYAYLKHIFDPLYMVSRDKTFDTKHHYI